MAGKMGNKFVALCSVAVGTIYAAGYAVTDSSQSALAQNNTPKPSVTGMATQGNLNQTTSADSNNAVPDTASSQSSSSPATATTGTGSKGTSTTVSHTGSTRTTVSKTQTTQTATQHPSAPPATQKYLDGTYYGSGTNRIGTVAVAVTIKRGKIANVQITQCDTHYDESLIDPVLPQQVMATQSPNVQIVSGATKSTEDFENAVYEALAQAHNPRYTGTGQ